MQVTRNIPVGTYPQEVVVRPDGKAAYVSCMHSDQVAEIDLGSWKVIAGDRCWEKRHRMGVGLGGELRICPEDPARSEYKVFSAAKAGVHLLPLLYGTRPTHRVGLPGRALLQSELKER